MAQYTTGDYFTYGGSAVSSLSNLYGAYASIKQSKYAQDILDYRAKYAEATQKIEVERIRRDVRRTISSQRAATAASGFENVGTPHELEIESEIEGDIDIALLRQAGSMEQLRLQTAGYAARSEGYGRAAGYFGQASNISLDTALSQGQRHGWFSKRAGSKTINPVYPQRIRFRNY